MSPLFFLLQGLHCFVLKIKTKMGQSDDERENVPDDSRDDDTVSWQRLIAAQMSKYV
jgi:hypothetical protein